MPPRTAELIPGSRIVFPYYDLRPGFATFLFLTNISSPPVSVALECWFFRVFRGYPDLPASPPPTEGEGAGGGACAMHVSACDTQTPTQPKRGHG